MALATTILALQFVRSGQFDKLPTRILEDAFIFSSVAYEYGRPGVLPDDLYDALGLELLCRKDQCSIDFHMAVNWDILRFKATNLALDFNSTMWQEADRDSKALSVIVGG